MKKYFQKAHIVLVMTMFVAGLFFVSCGDATDRFIGTWELTCIDSYCGGTHKNGERHEIVIKRMFSDWGQYTWIYPDRHYQEGDWKRQNSNYDKFDRITFGGSYIFVIDDSGKTGTMRCYSADEQMVGKMRKIKK